MGPQHRAPQTLYPIPYYDGGWTVAFLNEEGREISCRGTFYCSAGGDEGRAYAQEYADWRNAEMAAQYAERWVD